MASRTATWHSPSGATLSSCLPIPPTVTPAVLAARRTARGRPLRSTVGRVLLGCVGASWLALFVGWLSLHWLILPHIEEWRRPIEARASRMLGAPSDRRDRGAFERLGAGARAARRPGPRRRAAGRAQPAARLRVAVAALAARARAALRAAADRRRERSTCGATRAAASASPGSTSAARTRAPTTTATPPTGSSSSTSS